MTACTSLYKNLSDAAKTLGWTVKQINTQGTPESVQAAWKQAVNDKPDAVVASGFPRAVFSQQLKQLQQMKIPVIESSTDDVEGGGIDLILSKPNDLGPEGQILASWITKDSGGKANTLYVDLPVYNILKPVREYFEQNYAKLCAGCKLDKIDIPITAIGKDVPDRVVSYLRAHPDINYVAYSLGALNVGVPAALRQAGLANKVKLIVNVGDAENYQYIASGQTHAAMAFSNVDQTWVWADALARLFTGQSIDVDRKAHLPLHAHHQGQPDLHGQRVPARGELPGAVEEAVGQVVPVSPSGAGLDEAGAGGLAVDVSAVLPFAGETNTLSATVHVPAPGARRGPASRPRVLAGWLVQQGVLGHARPRPSGIQLR